MNNTPETPAQKPEFYTYRGGNFWTLFTPRTWKVLHAVLYYTALKAFGRIVKTLFILRYIDDVALRMAIEAQLNQVELANRFTRAVAVGNPREFAYAHQDDQQIAEACNRLIKNAIICWNYLYLEMRLRSADAAQRKDLLLAIKTHSPMYWAHINLLGEYDFSDAKLTDSHGSLPLN